jgi:transcriptional antiterminator RfaH
MWCCARTEIRRERTAQRFLQVNGFSTYLPYLREQRIRHGRLVEAICPLFPSYIFIWAEQQWHRVRWTVGVVGLIVSGEQPAPVAGATIDAIRARERDGVVELPERGLRRGDRVRILAGPFRSEFAIYQGMRPHERVEVLLTALGRVTLPRDAVEAVQ